MKFFNLKYYHIIFISMANKLKIFNIYIENIYIKKDIKVDYICQVILNKMKDFIN